MLQEARLVGEESRTEVHVSDAALCFKWSRPLWPDETRLRELSQKLTFVDFLEALGRFADLFSPLPRVSYGSVRRRGNVKRLGFVLTHDQPSCFVI